MAAAQAAAIRAGQANVNPMITIHPGNLVKIYAVYL